MQLRLGAQSSQSPDVLFGAGWGTDTPLQRTSRGTDEERHEPAGCPPPLPSRPVHDSPLFLLPSGPPATAETGAPERPGGRSPQRGAVCGAPSARAMLPAQASNVCPVAELLDQAALDSAAAAGRRRSAWSRARLRCWSPSFGGGPRPASPAVGGDLTAGLARCRAGCDGLGGSRRPGRRPATRRGWWPHCWTWLATRWTGRKFPPTALAVGAAPPGAASGRAPRRGGSPLSGRRARWPPPPGGWRGSTARTRTTGGSGRPRSPRHGGRRG